MNGVTLSVQLKLHWIIKTGYTGAAVPGIWQLQLTTLAQEGSNES